MTSPPSAPAHPAGRRRWRRRVLAAAAWGASLAMVVLLAIGAYLTSPAFVTGQLDPWLENKLNRQVDIQRVEPHWFRGFRLVGLRIFSSVPGTPPLLSVDSADVRISLADLLRGKLTLTTIDVDSPRLSAFRDSGGRLSIEDLLGEMQKDRHEKGAPGEAPNAPGPSPAPPPVPRTVPAEKPARKRPPRFRVREVSVRDGQIMFKDASLSPAIPIALSIEDLDFTMRDLEQAGPTPVSASFRARYQGVGPISRQRVQPIDLNLKLIQEGQIDLSMQEYRVDMLRIELSQRGRLVGAGKLDQPVRIAWDQRAPTVQINPADFSLSLQNVDLVQFNPQIFPNGADRITTGVLAGDLSASVGGGGRLVDLAGHFTVSQLGMTQFGAIDLWGAGALSLDLRSRSLRRYSAEARLIKDGRAQGKIRLRGEDNLERGLKDGSVSVERLDLTVLGANLAGMSRDVIVDSGKIDLEQNWSVSSDTKTLATRGLLTCADLVFQGETPDVRSKPLTVHVENDLRWDGNRLVGGGPGGRGARIETFHGDQPLDAMTVTVDVRSPDAQESNLVQVRGAHLSLDDYVAARQTARDGQRVARRRRKDERHEIRDFMEAVRSEILTSPSIDAAALSSPPRVLIDAHTRFDTPPAPQGPPPFAVAVEFGNATMAGQAWQDLRLRGRFADPRIEITTATARLESGSIVAQASCLLDPRPRAFTWSLRTQNLDIEKALAGMTPPWKNSLAGHADLQCDGTGHGADERALRDNLSASMQFRLAQGEARAIGPLTALSRALDIPEFAPFQFQQLSGEAVLRKGRVELSRVEAVNDQQKLDLRGSISFDGTIDWTFDAGIRGGLLKQMAGRPIVEALLEDEQGYSHFPALVHVIGTWEQAESRFGSPRDTAAGPILRLQGQPRKPPSSSPSSGPSPPR